MYRNLDCIDAIAATECKDETWFKLYRYHESTAIMGGVELTSKEVGLTFGEWVELALLSCNVMLSHFEALCQQQHLHIQLVLCFVQQALCLAIGATNQLNLSGQTKLSRLRSSSSILTSIIAVKA